MRKGWIGCLVLADINYYLGFPGVSVVKNPPANAGDMDLIPGREDPLEKGMATRSVFLPGKSHDRRSLVGYSHRVAESTTINYCVYNG